tara:strand:- start:826 stop:972 length:147 start_codon:yes stop_codon:yes gene_type:complete
VVVGVHEACGDHVTLAPHHFVARFGGHCSHGHDPTFGNGHVARMAGIA